MDTRSGVCAMFTAEPGGLESGQLQQSFGEIHGHDLTGANPQRRGDRRGP